MLVVPANFVPAHPNLVRVGMVKSGCLKSQFSLNYPTRLNGIINEHEFRESIININSKISTKKSQIVCIVIFVLCLVGGMSLVIAGATTQSSRFRESQSAILFGVGIGAIAFSSVFFTIGCCFIRLRRTTKMRRAIAEESKKFSRRSPTPCTWRLNVTTIWTGGYGRYRRNLYFYHVIIDIRRPVSSSGNARFDLNRAVSPSISIVRPSDDNPPPPYPGDPGRFCPSCGVARRDSMDKFCSSCGYPFNKY